MQREHTTPKYKQRRIQAAQTRAANAHIKDVLDELRRIRRNMHGGDALVVTAPAGDVKVDLPFSSRLEFQEFLPHGWRSPATAAPRFEPQQRS